MAVLFSLHLILFDSLQNFLVFLITPILWSLGIYHLRFWAGVGTGGGWGRWGGGGRCPILLLVLLLILVHGCVCFAIVIFLSPSAGTFVCLREPWAAGRRVQPSRICICFCSVPRHSSQGPLFVLSSCFQSLQGTPGMRVCRVV